MDEPFEQRSISSIISAQFCMTFDEAPSATISRQREHQSATPSRWSDNAEWKMKNNQQYVSKVLKGQENLSLADDRFIIGRRADVPIGTHLQNRFSEKVVSL